jgi:P pilus assembly chaperone PapD
MKKLVRFLAGFILLTTLAPAAQASFGIMPMEVQHKMPAQDNRLTDDIEVYNGSDGPVHITGSIVDWTLNTKGDYEYSEAGSQALSCAKWIQLSPAEFNVPAKKSVRVRYTITAPQSMVDERRAMIFFDSRPLPVKTTNGMNVMVTTRMGCKVFVSPTQALPSSAKISDIIFDNTLRARAKVSVQNPGGQTFRVKGKLEVRDESGKVVALGELKPVHAQVLPGAMRDLWFELSTPLASGAYQIKTVLDYGAKQLLGGELKFTVPAESTNLNSSTRSAAIPPSEAAHTPTLSSLPSPATATSPATH